MKITVSKQVGDVTTTKTIEAEMYDLQQPDSLSIVDSWLSRLSQDEQKLTQARAEKVVPVMVVK